MLKKKKRAGDFVWSPAFRQNPGQLAESRLKAGIRALLAISRNCLIVALAVLLAGCGPPGPRALRDGQRLMEQGNYDAAVQKLKMAVTLLPTNAPAWNDLGLACHHAGQMTNAVNAYRRALSLDPDLVEARYNLGSLFLEQNKLDGAKAEFTVFTLRRPKSVEGWLKLGSVQLRARDAAAAEKSFSEVLKIQTNNPAGWNGLGLVQLARNHPREAAQDFNAALKQQADYGPALLNLAVVSHLYLNNRQLALEKYREYASLKPRPTDADAALATARQLEQELNPPARGAATNAAAPVTSAATPSKPAATNGTVAVIAKPGKSESVVPTPKLAAPQTSSAPPAQIQYETVTLPQQPVVMPAQDAPPSGTTLVDTTSTASNRAVAAGSSTSTGPAAAKSEKRGFFQSLNPANWFRKEPKSGPAPTPLPPPATPTQAEPPPIVSPTVEAAATPAIADLPPSTAPTPSLQPTKPTLVSVPVSAPRSPIPGTSNIPRYAYRALSPPTAGNRSAAERAFAQGLQAQRASRLSEAMQAYRQAAKADPAYFEAYYNLGVAAYDAKAFQQALSAYESALAISPFSVDARFNFALTLRDAGYLLDAVAELERLLAANPTETRAHFALGNIYAQKLRQPAAARQQYLKVLELEPQHPQATAIRYWLAANPG